MTHWQCAGIPINYIYWAYDAPGYPEQKGMPHTIEWGRFAYYIKKNTARCDWCAKEIAADASDAIKTPDNKWVCLECQYREMELAEVDTREDDLKSQWMEEKYGYLRDEQ